MPISDRRSLRQQAADALRFAPNAGKLVLLFAGVTAGLALAAGIVTTILDSQIAGTGGLGGLQLRSTLSTIQALLNIAILVILPFWNLGYTSVTLKLGRGQPTQEKDLLDGFRRFGPALRLMLLRQVVYFAIGFAAMQVAGFVFAMSPWAASFYQLMEGQDPMNVATTMDEASLVVLYSSMIPYFIITGVLYLLALIPVTYRLRMAELQLMSEPRCGAVMAALLSNRMMKGNCFALFRLDLQFWWYYLANILLMLVCYGDMLLPLLGIDLPMDPTVSFFLFYVVSQAGQILLFWRYRNQVDCTYVAAFDRLRAALAQPPQMPQPPTNVPWTY